MYTKKKNLDLAFHRGSYKNSPAEALIALRMSAPDTGKHGEQTPLQPPLRMDTGTFTVQGGAKPHLKSICFILNWYLGLWLQLTDTTVTAIEISRLKIDVLGVSQSLFRISHPSS